MVENNIRVGDSVIISDFNTDYSNYSNHAGYLIYAGLHSIMERFVKGAEPIKNKEYIVLRIGQDLRKEEIVNVAVIMDNNLTKQIYIVELSSLILANSLQTIEQFRKSNQAASDLHTVITDILYHTTNYECLTELEEQIDEVYCRPEMIRLRNFIEGR